MTGVSQETVTQIVPFRTEEFITSVAGSMDNLWHSAECLSVNCTQLQRAASPKITTTPGAQVLLG